jgi:hypothetical protein
MESALNAFLNEMYETSEYLSDVAGSVKSSLEEMESLMGGAEATEVEFQVQKWLGSLYSVGMSQNATQSIADALGKIAAGDIDGLTSGGAGNLLIMAANDAGLSIADILTTGINSSDTNKLLQAAVNYLAELSDSAADNKVVQQQLANVFGVKASDLKAATNLTIPGSVSNIYNNSITYDNMLNRLHEMAGSMGSRTSIAEMISNIWDNGQYTLAGSMASNPISYVIYKAATLLDDTVGGIPFPDLFGFGTGVGLNTTIADLMRVASMGTGLIGSSFSILAGLGNSFDGRNMLNSLGINSGSGLKITPRGEGIGASDGGGKKTTSESGYASYTGNTSGSDIINSTMQDQKDTNKQTMIEAQEESEDNEITALNTTVIKIYELLEDVVHGNSSVKVKVEGYGLTSTGNGKGSLGGVSGLDTSGSAGGGASYTGGASSVNSGGVSGRIDFGGWTTT